MIRVMKSAPISSTHSARPHSIWAAPRDAPSGTRAGGADVERAGAVGTELRRPRSAPCSASARPGSASRPAPDRPRSGSTPARQAPWPGARREVAQPLVRRRDGRSRIPVRDTIQSSLTPSRSASSAVVSRPAGTSVATDRTAGAPAASPPKRSGEPRWRARSTPPQAWTSSTSLQRPLDKSGQHPARARLDEPVGAELVHRQHRLAPAHRHRQGLRQLRAQVLEWRAP